MSRSQRVLAAGILGAAVLGATMAVEAAWYILAPPHGKDPTEAQVKAAVKKPLKAWEVSSSYETQQECLQGLGIRRALADGVEKMTVGTKDAAGAKAIRSSVDQTQCVSGDDPRLR